MNLPPHELWAQFGPVVTAFTVNIVSTLLLLIGGWIVAGWARRATRRALGRFHNADRTLVAMAAGTVRYFILITVVVMVLAQFGVQTASIIAALGAIGLAVGLALQGTLTNIASGVMLLFLRPFRVGDYVNANGHEGTVEEIGLFTTEFTTYDGLFMTVVNAAVWGGPIINYTRNPNRRHDIIIGIAYSDDIERAQAALLELLNSDARVLAEPTALAGPQILVKELADSSVDLTMRFWTTSDDFWPASFDLRQAAKQRLDAAGITIPFPQRDVHHYGERAAA
jgi:small conductance mechanosensitive channel